MAAPLLVSKGTASKTGAASGTPADVTPTLPASIAANDILIAQLIAGAAVAPIPMGRFTPPSDWHEITQGGIRQNAGGPRGIMGWFWKRAAGGESGPVSFSTTLSCTNESGFHGQVYRITGCPTTGIPWESVAAALRGDGATTVTWPALTIGGSNRLVLAFVGQLDDTPGVTTPSGYTDPTGLDANATNQDTQLEVFEKNDTASAGAATGAGGETVGWGALHIAFHDVAQAEVSPAAFRGNGISDADGTTVAATPIIAIPTGVLLYAVAASDPTATSSGETTEHTITDAVGNVWTKLREHCRSTGVATGVTFSLWMTKTTVALTTSDAVTLTLGTSRVSKVLALWQATVAPGRTFALIGAVGAAGQSTAPLAASGTIAEGAYLFVAGGGFRNQWRWVRDARRLRDAPRGRRHGGYLRRQHPHRARLGGGPGVAAIGR